MDFGESVFASILIRIIDTIGYGLGMIVLAVLLFLAGAVIHYVLKWTGALRKPR